MLSIQDALVILSVGCGSQEERKLYEEAQRIIDCEADRIYLEWHLDNLTKEQ